MQTATITAHQFMGAACDRPAPSKGGTGFPLRMAREGDWVRITSLAGGKGFSERLAGVGLWIGARLQVLNNPRNGKLLVSHAGTRLFLGGGMAHRIGVISIEGENQ